MEKETTHQLKNENIQNFIFAGNATFTVVNETTGNRFTFRVRNAAFGKKDVTSDVFFVSVLTGQDNNSAYTFLGSFFNNKNKIYRRSEKSRVSGEALSSKVVTWFFNNFIGNDGNYPTVKVYHAGKCGKCGKKLTTPESIKSGLGPYCGNRG